MQIRQIILCSLALLCLARLHGQSSRVDSLRQALSQLQNEFERVHTLHQLFGALVNNHPDSALLHALQAFDLTTQMDIDTLHGQSIMNLTHAYFVNNELDSVKSILLASIPFYEGTGQYFFLSAVYRNLAVVGEVQDQPDTSLKYLQQCQDILAEHPDSTVLGDVYLSQGFAYRTKGYYELSIGSLLKALRIFELIGNSNRMGYTAQNIGSTLVQVGRLEAALMRNEASVTYFQQADNQRAMAQSLNNIGRLAYQLGDKFKAVNSHLSSIELARITEQEDVTLQNYWNLSRIYFGENQLDSARYWFDQTELLAARRNDAFVMGGVARYRSRMAIQDQEMDRAARFFTSAKGHMTAYVDPQLREEALLELSDIAETLEKPGEALAYWKQAKQIQDSLFTLSQDRQVEELQLIYETEKKDAQIVLLHRTAQLDKARRIGLTVGLILISIVAASIIYTLVLRRRNERLVMEKEKEIEIQKRRQVEQELEYKKRELVSKALQLARKNEFLASLQDEVGALKSTIDDRIQKSSRRISRLIEHDATDEEEWEQFSKEFATLHQEFLTDLKNRHGTFSSSDMRLIALLKMNLSSKDIAHTLRISYEGVKKARYRLRKKLELHKDIDLQAYLLAM